MDKNEKIKKTMAITTTITIMSIIRTRELLRPSMTKRGSSLPPLVIEIAVFFDCAATNTFLKFYENKATDVIDFMLSLVNAMQVRQERNHIK